MDLQMAIEWLYPGADSIEDFSVANPQDGSGARLVHWNEARLGPRPTDQQLADAELPAAREAKRAEMRRAFSAECRADLGDPYEAYGELAANPRGAAANRFNERFAKLRSHFQYIDNPGRTVAEIEAVSW